MPAARKPPHNVNTLSSWLGKHATEQDISKLRLQRWISFMVVAGALDRLRNDHDEPLFLTKGGVAMELRLREKARATKDFDATFRAASDDMLDRFDAAIRDPYGDFTFARGGVKYSNEDGFTQFPLKISYRGKPWQTITTEIRPADGVWNGELELIPAIDISSWGLDGPVEVACLSVRYQIAQKLHGCTEIFDDDRENDRARDLIDLLFLQSLATDLHRVKEACARTFEARAKQPWPPPIVVHDRWYDDYASEASEIDFAIDDVEEAAELVRLFIAEIDAA